MWAFLMVKKRHYLAVGAGVLLFVQVQNLVDQASLLQI
jgi:hypothetical protein